MSQHSQTDNGMGFALTAMQMAMIYESNGSDRPWVNLEQIVLRFSEGYPTSACLTQAWSEVVRRHEALRILIKWRNVKRAVQVDAKTVDYKIVSRDWSTKTVESQERALDDFLERDRKRGLDLQKAPAWRIRRMRTGPDSGIVVLTLHHALVDGRSMAQIVAELLQFAEDGAPTNLTSGPEGTVVPFSAVAQQVNDTTGPGGQAEQFFRAYLSDYDDIGALDLPRAPTQADASKLNKAAVARGARSQSHVEFLSPGQTLALEQQARACGATLANIVQGAWGLVLARWQGKDEVAIGTVRSGRHAVEGSQETVGCLINTLPLRMRISPDKTLEQFVNGLREDTRAMHPFEQTPTGYMRDWGGLGGHQPLFSAVVMFERGSMERLVRDRYHGQLRPEIALHEEGGLPLTLAAYGEDALKLVLEYDPNRVAEGTAHILRQHLCELLRSIAHASPDSPLSALSMMTADEQAVLLQLAEPDAQQNGPVRDVIHRFDDIVEHNGDAPAVIALSECEHPMFAETSAPVTYRALDARANGLAQVLADRGIGAGDMVAISLDRTVDYIVSMLAVLKRGAAFVPVDPNYPADHQRHMLSDSGARLVIARDCWEEPKFDLAYVSPDAEPQQHAPQALAIDPDARGYVIYTSGSTGLPKGVEVSRANFASHAAAIVPAFGLRSDDKVLQFASLSFDVALEEVFPTLLSGATLVLRTDDMAQSPAMFLKHLAAQKITVANIPTAFWSVLTDYMSVKLSRVPETLRLVIVGGELIKPQMLQKWQHVAPDVRWLNGYGPTEATITCTLYEPSALQARDEVPIGRATANARTYVLAADGSLAPRDVPGELAIGGAAVARGYLGQPEQTRQVFRPDPFAAGGRMYLTGDRARWRDDGQLSFLGRRDRQVKLRGFRIDLRDVERTLEDILPGAQSHAGVLNPSQPNAQLVVWVKPGEAVTQGERALRDVLARRLPEHMRPEVVMVYAFPTTAGGKVDQSALPLPVSAPSASNSGLVEMPNGSETPLERDVQHVMARVLGVDAVAVTDSFFDLGGHSLTAIELLGRLETATGQQLGIVDLQQNPSCRALARVIETGSSAPKHLVPIQPNGNRAPLFAVHVLGAEECYYRPLAKHLGPDQPLLGVSVGGLDENTPTGVEFTARRYCLDIMEYYPEGPINLMAVSLGSYVAFEMARQFRAAGREVAFFGMFDAGGPAGRKEVSGVARALAHVKQARQLGRHFPKHILQRRIDNLRYAQARWRAKRAEARGNGQTPTSISKLVALNELAVAAYEPAPLDVPLTIFRATDNVFDSSVGKATGLGWAPVAAKGYEVIDVPGGHLSMLDEPHVAHLAAHFADVLARLQRQELERNKTQLVGAPRRAPAVTYAFENRA